MTGRAATADGGRDADVYYLRTEQVHDGIAWAGPVRDEPPE